MEFEQTTFPRRKRPGNVKSIFLRDWFTHLEFLSVFVPVDFGARIGNTALERDVSLLGHFHGIGQLHVEAIQLFLLCNGDISMRLGHFRWQHTENDKKQNRKKLCQPGLPGACLGLSTAGAKNVIFGTHFSEKNLSRKYPLSGHYKKKKTFREFSLPKSRITVCPGYKNTLGSGMFLYSGFFFIPVCTFT